MLAVKRAFAGQLLKSSVTAVDCRAPGASVPSPAGNNAGARSPYYLYLR